LIGEEFILVCQIINVANYYHLNVPYIDGKTNLKGNDNAFHRIYWTAGVTFFKIISLNPIY